MSYREARSLQVLMGEVNAIAPKRSKASDGWIGDAAHASRDSDHNPWVKDSRGVGVVRARDFTHDPADGLDAGKLANAVAAQLGKHPALGSGAYVIYNRRIISTSRLREGWRSYHGANAHTKHVHVSVGTRGYDSTKGWGIRASLVRKAAAAAKATVMLANVRQQFLIAAGFASGKVRRRGGVEVIQRQLNRQYGAGLKVDGLVGKRTLDAWGVHERHVGVSGRPRIPDYHTLIALSGLIFHVK